MFETIKQIFCSHQWEFNGYSNIISLGFRIGKAERYICKKCLSIKHLD